MYMYDLILKKRNGGKLSEEEIRDMVAQYVAGEIPDYQMSAMLMAIYFSGMDEEETFILTDAMARSGDMLDLSAIEGIKVDKHSTGGVGDKTTLIISPIVASLGVKVAKMSGRGLGHTGGTVDKLESIPNFRVELDKEEFFDVVNKANFSVIGQSGNISPCDKKLYALRDVTATVDAIPLIASSIMSKKISCGADCILLDVKTGSGAFMNTLEDSIKLSKALVDIGERAGKKTMALITDMDIPLGNNIGNSLEVIEAIETLNGKGPDDLTQVCVELAANMLFLAQKGSIEQCREMVKNAIHEKTAVEYLKKMVALQGGDTSVIDDVSKFEKARISCQVLSEKSGYISHMDAKAIGMCCVHLGAGRVKKGDPIDYSAGIILAKKTGDFVEKGEVLATLYTNDEKALEITKKAYIDAITFSENKPKEEKLIYASVGKDKIDMF